jgi:cytochrome c-type biogenesis protein CcmH/NrfG
LPSRRYHQLALLGRESDLREALRIHPDHVPALNDLAVLLIAQGRERDARPLLERVLALRPDDAAARESLEAIGKRDG